MTCIYILASIAAGWFGQKIIAGKQRAKADQEHSDSAYISAVSAIRVADWELALSHLGLSIGKCPSLTAYHALGTVWGLLNRWDLAAEAFYRGRRLAGGGPGRRYPGHPNQNFSPAVSEKGVCCGRTGVRITRSPPQEPPFSRTECRDTPVAFHPLGSRAVVARFDGGSVPSDGGALL